MVVNYYYVFNDIAGPLSWKQQWRFWQLQLFELLRLVASGVRRRRISDLQTALGKLEGIFEALRTDI